MAFGISRKSYLRINKSNATWAAKLPAKSNMLYYNIDTLMNDIKFLLSNLYILHNEKLFRQVIGIPIGSDCSQDLANLFLFSYEHEHVDALMESGHEDADLLGHSHRYIDDLLVLNDMGYIDRMYQEIYPSELVLNKTNTDDTMANYLDLEISREGNRFTTKLFDKRNDFSFKVISLPHLKSCVPSRCSYGVFTSQVLRLLRVNSAISGFYADVKQLINKLCKQGYVRNRLIYYLNKFLCTRFYEIVCKYWDIVDIKQFSQGTE